MTKVRTVATAIAALVVATLLVAPPATAADYTKDDMFLRYRTFIPMKYTPATRRFENGPCTPKGKTPYRFAGDNRGWSPSAGSSRVEMDIHFDWSKKKPRIIYKNVSSTHRYKKVKKKWKHDATRTAKGTFKAKTNRSGKDFAIVEVEMSAKNPFCNRLIRPIRTRFIIRIEKKRTSISAGTTAAVPNHEVYVRRFGRHFTELKKIKSKDFRCLFIVAPCQSVGMATMWVSY